MTRFVRWMMAWMVTLALLLSPHVAVAVGFDRAEADIRRDWKLDASATVEATGGFTQQREVQNGAVVLVGRFPVSITKPTSRPGVTSRVSSSAMYTRSGDGWTFTGSSVGGWILIGMPDPSPEDLQLSLENLFPSRAGNWGRIVRIQTVMIPEGEANVQWTSFQNVELDLKMSYVVLEGSELVVYVEDRRMAFFRDGEEGPFTRATVTRHQATEHQRKPITEAEVSQLTTIWEQQFLDRLEEVEVPSFANPTDACRYVYDLLRSDASDERVQSVLIRMLSAARYFRSDAGIPNAEGIAWLENAVVLRDAFRTAYPPTMQPVRVDDASPGRVYVHFEAPDAPGNGRCEFGVTDGAVGALGHLNLPGVGDLR